MYLNQAELEMVCGGLLNDLCGELTWKWDDRFGALLAVVQAERQVEVRRVLDSHFVHLWDRKSIRQAPGAVKNGLGDFLDLRGEQLLFTSDPVADSLLFAAWWPWGDGTAISVRLASAANVSQPKSSGFFGRISRLFN